MLFESAPGIGKGEHGLASGPPEDGSAEKDGHAQRGRLPGWGARLKCLLVKAQEVEGEEPSPTFNHTRFVVSRDANLERNFQAG